MYKSFYEDYSHRTPFTLESINYIQKITGFESINSINFRQLPIIWKYNFLTIFAEITRIMCPWFLTKRFKWVRFFKRNNDTIKFSKTTKIINMIISNNNKKYVRLEKISQIRNVKYDSKH